MSSSTPTLSLLIFFGSLSAALISSRPTASLKAWSTSNSLPNLAANLTARTTRRGSSWKVWNGSSGVRIRLGAGGARPRSGMPQPVWSSICCVLRL